ELELAPKIQHPFHPKHPLTLLPKPPYYWGKSWCRFCRNNIEGFVYNCFDCLFDLHINCALLQASIAANFPNSLHPHPLFFIQNHNNEVEPHCSGCQKSISGPFYRCSDCAPTFFNLPKECAELPLEINHPCDQKCGLFVIFVALTGITPRITVIPNQVEDWMCKICYEEVDISYGHYRCPASRCRYIAHAHVVEQIRIGELMVASEIKHFYHDHNLRLTFSGKTKDDDSPCDGCTRPISTPFYRCKQCKFFLHEDCAELPKEMPHPFLKHLLTLSNSHAWYGYSTCRACHRVYQGFSYRCYEGDCWFKIDIQCMLLSDTLKHPSHEQSLFLVHNNEGTSCSACFMGLCSGDVAYRCMKLCDFRLDVGCATLPLTAWYKYDRHPLTLTYSDDSEPSQLYCDLCEKERRPNNWFYYCADCDNSLHLNCVIGDLPYMKLGNKFKRYRHKHPFTVVKNIWNCPPCKGCGEVCNGQVLECKESESNFTVHWDCFWRLLEPLECYSTQV
ncbi:hypothetical protein Gotri_025934, partial [Gossypium trilobum]|nr:hypothetical protein [Gossypium trilobum]